MITIGQIYINRQKIFCASVHSRGSCSYWRKNIVRHRPAVTIHFPAKGHKQELDILQKKACFHRFRGATVNGVRLVYANIYFTADGSRIYGEEEETLK